jgi:hypothetical protein
LAIDDDDAPYHGNRSIFAIFATRRVFGFCTLASALLALFAAHADLLSRSDANCEGLAAAKIVDLSRAIKQTSRQLLVFASSVFCR